MSKNEKKEIVRKQCLQCGEHKVASKQNFYMSNSELFKVDGLYPVCKDCVSEKIIDDDIETYKEALFKMDRPFLYDIYESSIKEAEKRGWKVWNCYMKNISMPQYIDHSYKHSRFEKEEDDVEKTENIQLKKENNFKVTDKIIDKWGLGYTNEEYSQFEKKYAKLINNYGEKTALHTEGLLSYIRFRVKEEIATAKGNVKEAKEWGALASKQAQDAKINVSQLSKSDISGGVDVLSQLFEAVETEVSIIPLLPKVIEQPYDDVDLIIWANINYYRKLEDKPMIEYKEIWNFYDQMLDEFFDSKGYEEEQIKEYKEKRNNVFRDLGKVYIEPLYDEGDIDG